MSTKKLRGISIVVPVLNEAGNVALLTNRLMSVMGSMHTNYELIFVDDHSKDDTKAIILKLAKTFKNIVMYYEKQGIRGKAYSILEGVRYARYDTVCMIDADLQYAPEYIAPMYAMMNTLNKDIVITNRTSHDTGVIRKVLSSGFNLVFTRILFGINYDTQSGLKLFRTKVFDTVSINPSPWGFDLEFIVSSLVQGFTIASLDIKFAERSEGDAKVNVIKTSIELAKESIKLRTKVDMKHLRANYLKNAELVG